MGQGRVEIRIDHQIDYALSFVFIGMVAFSIYSFFKVENALIKIEMAASIPLNLMAAISFLTREPALEMTYREEIVIPAISLTLPFLAMNCPILIGAPYSVPMGVVVGILGAFLGVLSFVYLRRSFAIMPAVRKFVFVGPYRVIRHPLYLGEFIYAVGIVMLAFNLLSLAIIIASIIFLVIRIQIEEQKLRRYQEYDAYAYQVRYRLIPYVY